MITIKSFAFNPFQENTFILSDDAGKCVIIDPGCYSAEEEEELNHYIESTGLEPIACLLTHSHIDHILGCKYVQNMYGLAPRMHQGELMGYNAGSMVANMYGIPNYEHAVESPDFIIENQTLEIGKMKFQVLFTPGHSAASVSFYNEENEFVIAGDVLFRESIGRTDLPGGDYATLEKSIKEKIYTLPKETVVYCGHGPSTTIRYEMVNNPFVRV